MKSGFLCLAVAALGFLSSCKKDNPAPSDPDPVKPGQKGTVAVQFGNYAGTQALSLSGTQGYPYVNANGDSFKVTIYKYYVSNIKFVMADGTEFAEPESYHLIDLADKSSMSFNMENVPAGTYTSVKVLLGVDSTRNVSGAQTGALDPMHGMFWTWSSGYIMAKIEGNSPQSSTPDGKLSFHLGGFSGAYSVLNEVTIPLPQNLVIGDNTTSTVTFKSDILKWFEAPHLIKFGVLNQIGSTGQDAFDVAKNYSHSLSVSAVQN